MGENKEHLIFLCHKIGDSMSTILRVFELAEGCLEIIIMKIWVLMVSDFEAYLCSSSLFRNPVDDY